MERKEIEGFSVINIVFNWYDSEIGVQKFSEIGYIIFLMS